MDTKDTEKKEPKQSRKKYATRGERSQKMFSFLLDNDLREWVEKQVNKGRYLNNLIRSHMDAILNQRHNNEWLDPDEWPSDPHDYQE